MLIPNNEMSMETKLNPQTVALIKDLQNDLNGMLKMDSNIEVVWKLQSMQNNKLLEKTASLIRDSIS